MNRVFIRVCSWFPVLAFLAASIPCALPAHADEAGAGLGASEQIVSFDSDITIRKNATLLVREAIRVRSQGITIRHGIYREFISQNDSPALRFRVQDAQLDQRPVAFRVEETSSGRRIYLGEADSPLTPGEHEFVLLYETEAVVSESNGRDRLYWNVTGNQWEFPIRWSKATVHLPDGIPQDAVAIEGFTGPYGATEKNYLFDIDTPGAVVFTAGMLGRNEGLTISVDWPRGFIHRGWGIPLVFLGNPGLSTGLAFLVVLVVYWLVSWFYFGKDPATGKITPRNAPPEKLSAAGARYLRQMWLDNKTFTTAIVSMAASGTLRVEDNGEDFVLRRTHSDLHNLAAEERAIAKALFAADQVISLRADTRRLRKALDAFRKTLRERYDRYFSVNAQFARPAWVIAAAGLAWSWYLAVRWNTDNILPSLVLILCAGGCVFLLRRIWPSSLKEWKRPPSIPNNPEPIEIERRYFWSIIGIVIVLAVIAVALTKTTGVVWTLLLAVYVGLNFFFARIMKAPTPDGQRMLDELEGFRRYLQQLRWKDGETIGQQRAVFERYMGYAMAFDLELQWAQRFYEVLEKSTEYEGAYNPDWYTGLSFDRLYLSSYLSRAAATASLAAYSHATGVAAPGGGWHGGGGSSSGGASGGGFSGGGAGAGGGGGW